MDNDQKIEIILTGGTIDSRWHGPSDTAIPNEKSILPEYFRSLFLYQELTFTEVCMKDSRHLTPEDIDKVLEAIHNSKADKIIVTHGTYTMPDTAKILEANLKREGQTIVLTGSMVPLFGFYPSDAPFNLGFALAKVRELSPGVYLSMNGEVFTPSEVAKNLSEGKFYSIFRKRGNNVQ